MINGALSLSSFIVKLYLYIYSANIDLPTPVGPIINVLNPLGGYITAALACSIWDLKLPSHPTKLKILFSFFILSKIYSSLIESFSLYSFIELILSNIPLFSFFPKILSILSLYKY